MGRFTADDEILEFAIAREVEAYYFYLALASRISSPPMRKVFEDLAKEELEHKEKLELEIIKLGKIVPQQMPEPPDQKDNEILDKLGFTVMDYKDMLLLGIEKEKVSFRTYIDLLPTVHNEQSRETLLALAEEEVKHKLRFENEYEMMIKEKKS